MHAIGVDIGGTKVAAGVVDEQGNVVESTRRPTPSNDPADTVAVVAAVVGELRTAHDVHAVGVGAAGWVDSERARVLFAPNLAWRDEPLKERLQAEIDLPVVIENDANAAAWAEYRFGAGRDERHLVVITVGTGIGSGLVLDGRLHRGRWGLAGEAGHMGVALDGLPCGCGNNGCWEQYASGPALVRAAVARGLAADSGNDVTERAQAGDEAAVAAFVEIGRWLGRGLADLAAILDPGCFVVGGGVADAGDLLIGPTTAAYEQSLTGHGHRPVAPIRLAALGNMAGLVGAADLARAEA